MQYDYHVPKPDLKTIPFMLWFTLKSILRFFLPAKKSKLADFTAETGQVAVWHIGHATSLIHLAGVSILTDPVFSRSLPFPARVKTAGANIANLPKLDAILLSHAHMDHWNLPSLRKLTGLCKTVIIPRNCRGLLPDGFTNIIELDWGQTADVSGLSIKCYKPRHWGDRYPWQANLNRGFNSYLIKKDGRSVFFCGDSAYDHFFAAVGKDCPPDIALLPISAYSPPQFRSVHMNPVDAIQAFEDLKAKFLIPIHWGNFNISLEPIDEPPRLLSAEAKKKNLIDRVKILDNGEFFKVV